MKRPTYAEQNSEWVYNWPHIIHNIRHGLFTEEEGREWERAADEWVTCACGNQCAAIPRRDFGAPEDRELARLGYEFTRNIGHAIDGLARNLDCDLALDTLARIEKRAAEILEALA